ncbi:MAG: GWxTD domain-containing protein [Chlorobi bacterium]|nr:GWxTD domain-containing protein [Chlorobiota bacterium]
MKKYLSFIFVLFLTNNIISQQFREIIYIDDIIVPSDSLFDCYFTYKAPVSNLVLKKTDGKYSGGFDIFFETKLHDGKYVRESSSEKIETTDYSETERNDLFLEGIVKFTLPKGKYEFTPVISIYNSKDQFPLPKISITLPDSLQSEALKPLVSSVEKVICNNDTTFKLVNFKDAIPFSPEEYFLLLPVLNANVRKIDVKIVQRKDTLISATLTKPILSNFKIQDCRNNIVIGKDSSRRALNLFVLRNFNNRLKEGIVHVNVKIEEKVYDYKLNVIWLDKPLSLQNIELAVKAVDLVLDDDAIYKILDAPKYDQYKLLFQFWEKYDRDTTTIFNELMSEFYKRVDFALKQYGAMGKRKVKFTDRAIIYVKYGKPENIDRIYKSKNNVFEVWEYKKLNKKFVFSDSEGLGKYKLVE